MEAVMERHPIFSFVNSLIQDRNLQRVNGFRGLDVGLLFQIMDHRNIEAYPGLPLWRIERDGVPLSDYNARKRKLLSMAVGNYPKLYLKYTRDPIKDGLGGNWICPRENTWLVPQNVNILELFDWLRPGNWRVYYSSRPIGSGGYNAKDPDSVVFLMKTTSKRLVIDSAADNDPWVVGIIG
jgi:hypothetical protein